MQAIRTQAAGKAGVARSTFKVRTDLNTQALAVLLARNPVLADVALSATHQPKQRALDVDFADKKIVSYCACRGVLSGLRHVVH